MYIEKGPISRWRFLKALIIKRFERKVWRGNLSRVEDRENVDEGFVKRWKKTKQPREPK